MMREKWIGPIYPWPGKVQSPEVQSYCQSLKNVYYKLSCTDLDWNEEILKK